MELKKHISMKPTQRLASWVLMIAVVSPLIGCSNPEDLVINGTLPQDKSTTVGKVFDVSFDDGKWSSTEDKKGRVIVTYTGKISKELHEKAVKKSLKTRLPASSYSEGILLQEAIRIIGIPSDFITSLDQKYKCITRKKRSAFSGYIDISCYARGSNKRGYMKDLRKKFDDLQVEDIKNNTWPKGTPVEFNFRLNKDGTSFKIYSVKSETWEKGKVIKADNDILEMSKVFETLYD